MKAGVKINSNGIRSRPHRGFLHQPKRFSLTTDLLRQLQRGEWIQMDTDKNQAGKIQINAETPRTRSAAEADEKLCVPLRPLRPLRLICSFVRLVPASRQKKEPSKN